MRESVLDLTKAIQKGLLPVLGYNFPGLRSCKNALPYGGGMEYLPPVGNYADLSGTYPFPQLLSNDSCEYVAYPQGLYEKDGTSWKLRYTLPALTQYDALDFLDTLAIVGNDRILIKSGDTLIEPTDAPRPKCGCNFRGLLVVGNISEWSLSDDVGASSIVWAARPLSTEFRLHEDNIPTGAGYMQLFCGQVLRIFEDDKRLVVFGTKGIEVLSFISEPLPTFGRTAFYDCSISNRDSIAQAGDNYYFVSSLGELHSFTAGKVSSGIQLGQSVGVTKIGFGHIFYGTNNVALFDSGRREALICNGLETIVVSPTGVGQRDQVIASYSNGNYVVSQTNSTGMEIVVMKQNMSTAGIKTLYAMPTFLETDGTVTINGGRVGPENVGTKVIAFESFDPTIRISALSYARISGAELRWKLTDKRFIRGQYDNAVTS